MSRQSSLKQSKQSRSNSSASRSSIDEALVTGNAAPLTMPPQSSDFAGADPTESFVYRGDREYLSSATQVHGFCRSYLVISTLRWLLLLTLCMAVGVPVYHKVDVYYRGQIDVCGACLFKARADPAHFYEWSICAANNVTEFRAATDYNLLRELSNNVNFAPSSDLAQIIPVSAFLYGMAMLGFISFGLYLCIWTKKSNDSETASAEYFRQATVINIVFAVFASYMLVFAFGLVLDGNCYIMSFPRILGFLVIIPFFVALICLATFGVMAIAPCCDDCGRKGGHAGVMFAGAFCMILSLCMLFLTCIIITARGGPAFVVLLGLCAFVSAAETLIYAAYTGRRHLAWSFIDSAE